MIDLHVHSSFSDGSMTPLELVAEAVACGVSVLALTDHDTTQGLDVFMKACAKTGGVLTGVPGVEISVDCGCRTMHMLGYFIAQDIPDFEAMLRRIRDGRNDRNAAILARLDELGMPLTVSELRGDVDDDTVIGRPHIAAAMVRRGYVQSHVQAFAEYLGKGCPAYMERYRPSPENGIEAIRKAGGVAVLAHPGQLRMGKARLARILEPLVAAGLGGIEAYHSEHSPQHERRFLRLADEFNLVVTGGSDFHGDLNPKTRMGRGFGKLCVPLVVLEDLKERLAAQLTCHP